MGNKSSKRSTGNTSSLYEVESLSYETKPLSFDEPKSTTTNDEPISEQDLVQLQESTNFNQVEIQDVLKEFKRESGKQGYLTKYQFKNVIVSLQKFGLRDLSQDPFVDNLFDSFDTDKDGKCDLKEFMSGISLLCKGTPDEKLELTFNLWDENKDGYLDQNEMNNFFISCYTNALKILMTRKFKPYSYISLYAPQLGRSLGIQIGNQIFPQVDTDNSGKITMEEFKKGFIKGMNISCQFEGGTFTQVIGFF